MARQLTANAEVKSPQVSFAGGELSEGLYGRVDLAKFQVGLRKTKNCYIEVTGGVSNRAGLKLATEVKTSANRVRIEEFAATVDLTFLLEFGPNYIRILYRGAYVLDGSSNIIDLVTPYSESEVFELDFDQVNDVMTIVHPNYDPYELRRVSNILWTFTAPAFTPTILAPTGLNATENVGGGASDRSQRYKVSSVKASGEESLPSGEIIVQNSFENADDRVSLAWNAVTDAVRYNVYKYQGGVYAYMGFSETLTITDNNIVPNVADTPRSDFQPFTGVGNKPATTFFYQQRRGFGGPNLSPQTLTISESGLFNSFKRSVPGKATDGLQFALAAKQVQKILYAIAIEDLILFTPTTEWRIVASGGFSAVEIPDARPQSYYGSARVKPLVIGADVLYIQRLGQTVYRFNYSNDFNRYVSEELSILSRHLIQDDDSIVSWASAAAPYNLIWLVRSDGKFLSMTHSREQQIFALTQHDTQGLVEWSASVNENGVNVPYFVVRRRINGVWKRFIEYMDPRKIKDPRRSFFVDCGGTYDVPLTVTGISTGATTTLTVVGHGLANGDPVYVDAADGVPGVLGRYRAAGVTANTFRIVNFGDNVTEVVSTGTYLQGGVVRKMVTTVSGVSWLNGMQVVGVGDGLTFGVEEPITVSGGSFTIPFAAGIINFGLAYTSSFQTLELDRSGETRQGTAKTAPKATLRVVRTRGLKMSAGRGQLLELKPRQYEDYYDAPALNTGLLEQNLTPSWDTDSYLTIQQDYPLPMTVVSVIPDIQYGR